MLGTPYQQYHQESWVGDFDGNSGELINITQHAVMDYGLWYAAKGHTPAFDNTQHIVFGWMHCLNIPECAALTKVCGNQYTFPRLMSLTADGSEMRLKPLPALTLLHLPENTSTHAVTTVLPGADRAKFLVSGHTTSQVKGTVLHINALLPCSLAKTATFFGVHVLSSPDLSETTTIGWNVSGGCLSVDRSKSGFNRTSTTPMTAPHPEGCPAGATLNLTIIVDGGILETHVNDKFAITTPIWTADTSIVPRMRTVGLYAVAGADAGIDRRVGSVAENNESIVMEVWQLGTDGAYVPETPYG
jgi:sucrose-6-phosphate hydrolase SacC (GH32 family)